MGLSLIVVGLLLVLLTHEPSWCSLTVVGAAALGLGGLPRPVLAVMAALGALTWVAAIWLHVLDDEVWTVRDTAIWGTQTLALLGGGALSVLALRHTRRERDEVRRAVAFAMDATVHDGLTGLANRRGFAMLGGQILESARRLGDAVYCVFIDVDGLSRVQSRLGQEGYDEVLLTVAEALRRTTRRTDAVARWDDDSFVVVGPGTGLPPQEMERRIRAQCSEHSIIDRTHWHAKVSAGGAVLEPWDDGTLDMLLARAGREMHLRRALRREAGIPAYRPTRLDPSPRPPKPRQLND